MVKITGLTRSNILALEEVFPVSVAEGDIVLTATTATWTQVSAPDAWELVSAAMERLATRGHPRASLHAVRRKLAKAEPQTIRDAVAIREGLRRLVEEENQRQQQQTFEES